MSKSYEKITKKLFSFVIFVLRGIIIKKIVKALKKIPYHCAEAGFNRRTGPKGPAKDLFDRLLDPVRNGDGKSTGSKIASRNILRD